MRGGYFHSVGHTELNGLAAFLAKIGPGITWTRCFPGKNTLKPKPMRSSDQPDGAARPRSAHAGMTGPRLVDEMLSRLETYHRGADCNLDFVLLIDDADCRFGDAGNPGDAFRRWLLELTQKVKAASAKPDLEFFALLAWPEVETWLVADWENGFGKQYAAIKDPLHAHIKRCVLNPLPWARIEDFGGGLLNGTCRNKLSARLQDAFVDKTGCTCSPPLLDVIAQQPATLPLHYSKQVHGGAMLSRITPESVDSFCPRFRQVHQELKKFVPRSV